LPLRSGGALPEPAPPIASAWLVGSGGFMGQECVSVWIDAAGAASLDSVSADERSFRLAPGLRDQLMRDLAEAWPLATPGTPGAPGDDLIRYTLQIVAADGTVRSFSYADGAKKPEPLARIHRDMLAVIDHAPQR
jgi:hypothetical protein